MGEYPNIADHGLIGDLQTAALVSTDGTIDWFCSPRFDSPSIFGSLLDAEQGGFCQVRPTADDYVTRQLYLPNTAILVTRFMTEAGVGEVTAFVPIAGAAGAGVEVTELAATTVAVLVHDGPFADLDQTYGALGTLVAERGIGGPGPIREHYLTETSTEVCWPVITGDPT